MRALGFLLVFCLALPVAARPERARAMERIADEHRREGRFELAASGYRDAWIAHPAPRYLFRLGQCEWARAETGRALFYFEAYLAKGFDPPFEAKVKAHVAEARALLKKESASRSVPRVALLPVDGPASEQAEELTARLHAALQAANVGQLRGLDQTYADLHQAALVGVDCAPPDDGCQRRLLPLLGVDALITARPDKESLWLSRVTTKRKRAKPRRVALDKLEESVRVWGGRPVEKPAKK